jgi:GT2 family glycosyltransferase
MYAEEVDLSYRLKQMGWETHFTPTATIIHLGGASTRQQRAAMAVQYFTSLTRFYHRYYSKKLQARLNFLMKSMVLARLLRDMVKAPFIVDLKQRAQNIENQDAWRKILVYRGIGAHE